MAMIIHQGGRDVDDVCVPDSAHDAIRLSLPHVLTGEYQALSNRCSLPDVYKSAGQEDHPETNRRVRIVHHLSHRVSDGLWHPSFFILPPSFL